jgi:hypothetical protein
MCQITTKQLRDICVTDNDGYDPLVVVRIFFPLLRFMTGFIQWVTQRVVLEEQVLLTRRDKPSSSQVLVRFVNNNFSIVCLFVFILLTIVLLAFLTIVLLAFLIAFFDIFKLFLCQNSVFPTILDISVSKLNGDTCKLPTQYHI